MEKTVLRNLSIGFIIGFLLGWWWTRDVLTVFQRIIIMIIIGLIGGGIAAFETIVHLRKKENIESGKKVKWWQKDLFSK